MMRCAVSTSWRSEDARDATALVSAMGETGVGVLEIEFRVGEAMFNDLMALVKSSALSVHSLHAICPASTGRGRGAEEFLISDPDEDRRRRGALDVVKTLRAAAEIGASAIVLHCGNIAELADASATMMRLRDAGRIASEEAEAARRGLFLNRTAGARKHFPSLLKSLDEINREAVKLGVNVGLENRYYFHEFPLFEEFGVIFNRFDGGRLGYWHDTGHAHTLEILFGIPHRTLLETFGDRLIGIHLHDVVRGYTDHNEPGCGEVDFDMVAKYLRPDTIRVMELHKRITPDAARRGVEFLRSKNIFD